MAIAPIDLQTLFTQLDKVAKTQNSQREGLALQQAIQGAQIQKKTEQNIQQVNEAQNTGEGAEKINDREQERRQHEQAKGKNQNEDEQEEESRSSVLKDPSLGKKIDISL